MSEKMPSLPAGTPVQIEVETADQKFNSFIVGSLAEEFLILKTPVSNHLFSARPNLFIGNKVVVRFLIKGTIFGFKSSLMEVASSPTKLIFIEYPAEIVHHELRSQKRIECNLPLKAVLEGKTCPGLLLDMNEGGCKFSVSAGSVSPDSISVNGDMQVRFFLPGIEQELEISGKHKHTRSDYKKIFFGMKFNDLSQDIAEKISRYLASFEEANNPA